MRSLKLDKSIFEKINKDINTIDKEILRHQYTFDIYNSNKIPEERDIEASALFFHSFYNGIENIISVLLKANKEELPNGEYWHTDLLNAAFNQNEKRNYILNINYKEKMDIYKSFRHKIRHIYPSEIKWEEMSPLIENIKDLWKNVKNDIVEYINNIEQIKSLECYRHENCDIDLIKEKNEINLIDDYGNNRINKINYNNIRKYKIISDNKIKNYILYAEANKNNFSQKNVWFLKSDFNKESAAEFINQWNKEYSNVDNYSLQSDNNQKKKTGR